LNESPVKELGETPEETTPFGWMTASERGMGRMDPVFIALPVQTSATRSFSPKNHLTIISVLSHREQKEHSAPGV